MLLSNEEWKKRLDDFPGAHLLQTAEWGELKSSFSWKTNHIANDECQAQVMFRSLPGGFSVGYIPKGPLGGITVDFLEELKHIGKKNNAIMIKIEPDGFEAGIENIQNYKNQPNLVQSRPIQPAQTIVVDISGDETSILSRMKQKTRYNIHLAEKKEISVIETSDVDAFYKMMTTTGTRDGFGVHSLAYYKKAYSLFSLSGECVILTARFGDTNLASVMIFRRGKRCWYFYGASTEMERNRMPVYLLQWEVIRWAKKYGCTQYDLWGIPDASEQELEEQFMSRADGLWGVYRFKRGFGGNIKRSVQTYDLVLIPLVYKALLWWTESRNRGVELG